MSRGNVIEAKKVPVGACRLDTLLRCTIHIPPPPDMEMRFLALT